MWNSQQTTVGAALGKGCLAGVGLALGFFILSVLAYGLLGPFGLPHNIRLLVAIASGPILGTLAVVVVFLMISRKAQQTAAGQDGSASRDEP